MSPDDSEFADSTWILLVSPHFSSSRLGLIHSPWTLLRLASTLNVGQVSFSLSFLIFNQLCSVGIISAILPHEAPSPCLDRELQRHAFAAGGERYGATCPFPGYHAATVPWTAQIVWWRIECRDGMLYVLLSKYFT